MAIKINGIEIPDSQLGFLREIYKKKYDEYLIKKESVLNEGKEMEPILIALGILPKNTERLVPLWNISEDNSILIELFSFFDFQINVLGDSLYSKSWPWLQKCKRILEIANRPLTSVEVMEILIRYYEPELHRAKIINSIPATMSVAARDGKLRREQRMNGEYEYSLIENVS